MDNKSKLLRGSLETIIVKMLSDHGEMYGYEITQQVKEQTSEGIKLTEGALYPLLHKLEAQGILEVEVRSIGNRFRKYYKLTSKGKKASVTLLEEMNEYLQSMHMILNPNLA